MHFEVARPCRQCPDCLAYKRWSWALRCRSECQLTHEAGRRTWFSTLTASPEVHVRSFAAACHERWAVPYVFPRLPVTAREEFLWRHQQLGREVAKYLKRLRKNEAKFRFICVVEPHTERLAGCPHYHLLIHEMGAPIRKRVLIEQWPHGHSKHQLVTDSTIVNDYCTKYLAKDIAARVRASIIYGLGGIQL